MRPPLRIAAALWTLVIFGLCWTPRTMMPVPEESTGWLVLPNLDKVVHFGLFAGFGLLWGLAGVRQRWVVAAGLLAALVSELGQELPVVNRDAEWGDGIADGLGVLAGVACAGVIRRRAIPAPRAPQPVVRVPSARTP